MVGTIVSMVYGERKEKAIGGMVAHTIGLIVGGLFLGLGLGVIGYALRWLPSARPLPRGRSPSSLLCTNSPS